MSPLSNKLCPQMSYATATVPSLRGHLHLAWVQLLPAAFHPYADLNKALCRDCSMTTETWRSSAGLLDLSLRSLTVSYGGFLKMLKQNEERAEFCRTAQTSALTAEGHSSSSALDMA